MCSPFRYFPFTLVFSLSPSILPLPLPPLFLPLLYYTELTPPSLLGSAGSPGNLRYQTILFSATFNDNVRQFADRFAPNANKIELKKEEVNVGTIKQFFLDCASKQDKYDKLVMLYNILTVGQSIIFCQVSGTGKSRSEEFELTVWHILVPARGRQHRAADDQGGTQGGGVARCEGRLGARSDHRQVPRGT